MRFEEVAFIRQLLFYCFPEGDHMKRYNILRLAVMAMLIAVGVVISPILRIEGMCPMAHLINITAAVLLGPLDAFLVALFIGIIRMCAMGIPPLALTGAVFGALLSGILYKQGQEQRQQLHRHRHHRRYRFLPCHGFHHGQRRPRMVLLRSLIHLRNIDRRHSRSDRPLQAPAYGRFEEDADKNS